MTDSTKTFFTTRGVILLTQDILTGNWLEKAKAAQLTTLATHIAPKEVAHFMRTPQGRAFAAECGALGIEIEHELHAINELLPRELFDKDPSMFRMNEDGQRTPDWNLCVHSEDALSVACENAVSIAEVLRPTTGRYFFWIDDGKPMCKCPQCKELSDSEQALIFENRLLEALQEVDSRATLAHLAYLNTLTAPVQVKPNPGIFLEFAPIQRSLHVPLRSKGEYKSDPSRVTHDARFLEMLETLDVNLTHAELLEVLDANLKVFGADNAQALEYWLDVSLLSDWNREKTVKLPWNSGVLQEDLELYSEFGIRNVTCFACWIDGDYIARFGEPPIQEYGDALLKFK